MPRSKISKPARLPRTIRILVLTLALVIVFLMGWRVHNQPSPLAASSPLPSIVINTNSLLRLVSYNIYNRPWERGARLDTLLETLREQNADIIALQEAATGWILPGDPSEYLAQALGMKRIRYWHEQNGGIFKTGISVLSRYPILSSVYHEFARHDFWDAKGYVWVRIQTPQGVLQLVNLHMASTSDSSVTQDEWQELARFIEPLTHQGPVLIMGDFNTEPTHPALKAFMTHTHAQWVYEGRSDLNHLRSWTPDYRDDCSEPSSANAQLLDHVFVVPGVVPAGVPATTSHSAPKLKLTAGQILRPTRLPHPSDHCPIAVGLSFVGGVR
ncbi:endonuclease/exonuclease/phosphatase family protein [Bdellovibrionota bacterium FG-1]